MAQDLFGNEIIDNRKEVEIQKNILEYLRLKGVFAWRNNNIAVQGRVFVGLKGVSDILGIFEGKFLAIEVKSKNGKPSSNQSLFIDQINKQGGIAFIARSIQDVEDKLFKKYS